MYSPPHRPSTSVANATSPGLNQRRMSASVPPPSPLNLPEPLSRYAPQQQNQPRSSLRNAITREASTDSSSEDGSSDQDTPWGSRRGDDHDQRSHSPSPSLTKFASSFAHHVGSLVNSVSPTTRSSQLPTDAEIEAEAEYQRERSRREAERILTQEGVERKKVEERVLEMLEAKRTRPTRSQTAPSPAAPPSPVKESTSWWSTAKSKLTPNKEKDLTPAQQIIQDTKAREKERRKSKDKEWPSNGKNKYNDIAYQQLSLPPGARPPGPQVGGGAYFPSSPGSPSPRSNQPPRQLTASPTAMTPSPSRDIQPLPPPKPHHNNNSTPYNPGMQHPQSRPLTASPIPSTSTSHAPDAPPLYAQFSSPGVLDVQGTLLTIARRFEKLERWAVGHTRALEERMSDVEKWLVDKEREREREREVAATPANPSTVPVKSGAGDDSTQGQVVREVTIERKTIEVDEEVKRTVGDLTEGLGELRGRLGELGREVARLASSVPTHSNPPSEASGFGIGRIASPATDTPAASPSPRILPTVPSEPTHNKSPSAQSIAQSETASIISSGTGASARTKLPYPSGDYAPLSPASSSRSPPSAQNYAANNASSAISRTRPLSYGALPIPPSSLPSTKAPVTRGTSAGGSPALPAPTETRGFSPSPSSRKRYTVALGQPLSSSSPSLSAHTKEPPTLGLDERQGDFGQPLFAEPQTAELHTAFFTDIPGESERQSERNETDTEDDLKKSAEHTRQETIGSTPITLSRLSASPPPSQNSSPSNRSELRRSPRVSPSHPRVRPQSVYGIPGSVSMTSMSDLEQKDASSADGKGSWRTRSRSIDRIGLGIDTGRGAGNFVDPLFARRKEREKEGVSARSSVIASPGTPRGRVPFGDLLAFFDPEKQ